MAISICHREKPFERHRKRPFFILLRSFVLALHTPTRLHNDYYIFGFSSAYCPIGMDVASHLVGQYSPLAKFRLKFRANRNIDWFQMVSFD